MLSLFECFLLHPTLVPYMFFEFLFHCLLVGTVSFDGQMLFFANFMYHHYPMFFNVVLPPVSKSKSFRTRTRSSKYNFDHYFLLKYVYKN
jgi:hypothetical protein